ncbi:hypothetical protein CkaCkLH20_10475 [Colletotrichum karsti]|uniref:Uncharacterized protein n=1 Tax=Colletotrichum karsti TaxID=1095194 RepID=A0A9P6HVH2_9PEZI|nr:uncharacterized protein CkaCkLH20_10475 [Colletotrichum karsti]KAF9872138.1 hypothetical protein CkaCkLH20_10475 [Colletotrichum karsti]
MPKKLLPAEANTAAQKLVGVIGDTKIPLPSASMFVNLQAIGQATHIVINYTAQSASLLNITDDDGPDISTQQVRLLSPTSAGLPSIDADSVHYCPSWIYPPLQRGRWSDCRVSVE